MIAQMRRRACFSLISLRIYKSDFIELLLIFRPAIEYVHSPTTNGNSPQDGSHVGMVASSSSRELVALTQSNNQTNPSTESGSHTNFVSNRDNVTSGSNRENISPVVNNASATQVERGNRDSRRRSTRHRNYLNRSQLHNAVVELPDGYGK